MSGLTHGSHASVGDYVQLLDASGEPTDLHGIVCEVETDRHLGGRRFLHVNGHGRVRDCYVRLVSVAVDNKGELDSLDKADLDAFGSDLADI
jgi:hypothetical protein